MSSTTINDATPPTPAARGWAARVGNLPEMAIELVIRLCGCSAIFFVFAIFFFVFREGAPMLFGELDLGEFFTSTNWHPVGKPAALRNPGAD